MPHSVRTPLDRSIRKLRKTRARAQESQSLLIEYLRLHIAVSFALLHRVTRSDDRQERDHSCKIARRSLDSIYWLADCVHDPVQRTIFDRDLDRLESTLQSTMEREAARGDGASELRSALAEYTGR